MAKKSSGQPTMNSARLKKIRNDLGLTMQYVEKVTGISTSHLTQLEGQRTKGIKRPSAEVMCKLANLYGMTTDKLLSEVGIQPNITPTTSFAYKLTSVLGHATEKEEKEILEYAYYLKYKRKWK